MTYACQSYPSYLPFRHVIVPWTESLQKHNTVVFALTNKATQFHDFAAV